MMLRLLISIAVLGATAAGVPATLPDTAAGAHAHPAPVLDRVG